MLITILEFLLFLNFNVETEESIPKLFDINFIKNIKIKDKDKNFNFEKEKKQVISINEKMKTVSCLNLINELMKKDASLKDKFKNFKNENKENYKVFINNITQSCIQQIKNEEIDNILNYDNKNIKDEYFKILKLDENIEKLLKQNEIFKKMREIEIANNTKHKRVKIMVYTITCIFISLILWILLNKNKKEKKENHKDNSERTKKIKNKKK